MEYEHPGHVTVPCKSGIRGGVAYSELFKDGVLLKRFELPVDERPGGDEYEAVRLVEHESIAHWNELEAARLRQEQAQAQGAALLAAFSDPVVFDQLVSKVAEALEARREAQTAV